MKSAKKIFFSISVLIVSMALIINFTNNEQSVEINQKSTNDKVITDKDVKDDSKQIIEVDETDTNDYKIRSRSIVVLAKNTLMDKLTNYSELKIESDEAYTQEELIKKIRTYPKVSFMIREENKNTHFLTFRSPLDPGSNFKMVIDQDDVNYEWTFDIAPKFGVESITPKMEKNTTTLEDPIIIKFNRVIGDAEVNVDIFPVVESSQIIEGNKIIIELAEVKENTAYEIVVSGLITGEKYGETCDINERVVYMTPGEKALLQVEIEDTKLKLETSFKTMNTFEVHKLEFNHIESLESRNAAVKIHRYKMINEFSYDYIQLRNAEEIYANDIIMNFDISKSEPVHEFDIELVRNKEYAPYSLVFPNPLEEGYYLAEITIDQEIYQVFLQVNDMSVYAADVNEEILLWVNDVETNTPINNGKIVSTHGYAYTNYDGISIIKKQNSIKYINAVIENKDGPNYYLPQVRLNNTGAVSRAYGLLNKKTAKIVVDRTIYTENDIVNFYGFINKTVKGNSNYSIALKEKRNDHNRLIGERSFSIDEHATFAGQFYLIDLAVGEYVIEVYNNEELLGIKNIYVTNKVEKEYGVIKFKDEIISNSSAIEFAVEINDQKNQLNDEAEYVYSYNDYAGSYITEELQNLNGVLFGSIELEEVTHDWRPEYIHVDIKKEHNKSVIVSDDILVFPRDTMVEVNYKVEGKLGKIDVNTHVIDIEKLNVETPFIASESFRGEAIDRDLKLVLIEHYEEKEKTGDEYDYVNKKVVPQYNYNEVSNVISTFEGKTTAGIFQFETELEEGKYYTVVVSTMDSQGKLIREEVVINDLFYSQEDEDRFDRAYHLDLQEDTYSQGDKIKGKLMYGSEYIRDDEEARVLLINAKNRIEGYFIEEPSSIEIPFNNKFESSYSVFGAYYSNGHLTRVDRNEVKFDYQKKNVELEIYADKEMYEPEGIYRATVKAVDTDGKPLKGTLYIDVLKKTYSGEYSRNTTPLYDQYQEDVLKDYDAYLTSEGQINFRSGIERSIEALIDRSKSISVSNYDVFRYNERIKIDDNGEGLIEIQLPSDLGEYEIMYQFNNEALYMGNGKAAIVINQPLYTNICVNKHVLTDENISLALKSYGTLIDSDSEIEYTFSLYNEGKIIYTTQTFGKGYDLANGTIPKLEKGVYSLEVISKYGETEYKMSQELVVSEAMNKMKYFEFIELDETLSYENVQGEFDVLVYSDKQREILDYLLRTSKASSRESGMSYGFISKFSQNMLKDYFNRVAPKENNYAYNNNISKLVEQDDKNMAMQKINLTLALAVSGLESDHNKKLIEYFQNNLKRNTRIDQLICSAGLGIYNGIHNEDLAQYNQPNLTKEEKVYLALAYSIIGNHEASEILFVDLLNHYFVSEDGSGYLDFGTQSINQHYTALIGIVASKLGRDEYELVCEFLQMEKIVTPEIELLKTWLSKEVLENNIGSAKLKYNMAGYDVDTVVDLRTNPLILRIDEVVKGFKVIENPENLQFMISGYMDRAEAVEKHIDSINVRKYYDTGDRIKQGDTITVYVEVDITDNQHKVFNVADSIPTGFKYVKGSLENGVLDKKSERLLNITAVGESDQANVIILKYNLLAMNIGKVRTEEAIVSSFSDDKFGYSGSGYLTVVEE